jgi:hypothetical protein
MASSSSLPTVWPTGFFRRVEQFSARYSSGSSGHVVAEFVGGLPELGFKSDDRAISLAAYVRVPGHSDWSLVFKALYHPYF